MTNVSAHTGTGAVAVTPHHDATAAALQMMRHGGTAADAVVAANAVLGMVLPTTCGIGGDLFAIVHHPGQEQPDVLNASGRGGSGLDAARLRSEGLDQLPTYGPLTVSVPGCVDGWEALLARHGRLDLSTVLEPAIALGREGFIASLELAEALRGLHGDLGGQPSARHLYPDGAPPAPKAVLARPDLASTLETIATDGRAAFYEGPVGDAIVTATEGTLTASDLVDDSPDWVDPLGANVFGLDAWTIPPNSQGYLTLATCAAFESLGVDADPADPRFHHALIEAYRAFAWERNDVVADPDHLPWPLTQYLSTDRIAEVAATIDLDRATPRPEPTPGPPGTAFFCAMDADGMAVACIQSNYFGIGSRVSAGETGVFLHNRGAGFTLIGGHPNEAAPGRRPLHTLAPTLWTRNGETALVLGTRGGDQQPQYLAQMAAAMLRGGLDPTQAQAAPRWSLTRDADVSGVSVELGMPEHVVAGLRSRGHTVTTGPARTPGWGPISVIAVDSDGRRAAAADPRVTTATADGD